jgi:hypothetical protein
MEAEAAEEEEVLWDGPYYIRKLEDIELANN